jgi:hypothetical protein
MKKIWQQKAVLISIGIVILTILYHLSAPTADTPYNYFTRLANAFIHGHIWLNENPSWLNELIPAGNNKYYVPYPPMPAIIAVPLVAIFGVDIGQQWIAHVLQAIATITMAAIAWEFSKSKKMTVFTLVFAGFGNITWFLSSVGSSWYLGQISAYTFLTLGVYEIITRKRGFIIGLLFGAAYLSRIHTILSVPIMIWVLWKEKKKKEIVIMISVILCFIAANCIYNFTRFGVLWDKSYLLIPGVTEEPWFQKGIIHPQYILENAKVLFWSFPKIVAEKPFIQPSWAGLAIWITSPLSILALWAPIKKVTTQAFWLSSVLIGIFVMSHGSTGFTQFGYRFAVDFYAFLIPLVSMGVVRQNGPNKLHWFLLVISLVVNAWGVVWINKMSWVGF